MDPISVALITGGASLLGNVFSSQTSAAATDKANQMNIANSQFMQGESERFNQEQADLQRQWQEKMVNQQNQMANSAYQRQTADMKAAGLNPILSAGGGGGAPFGSAGSGATASVGTGSAPNIQPVNAGSGLAHLGEAVSKAVNSAVAVKSMDKMAEEIATMKTEQAKKTAETVTESKRPAQVEAMTKTEEKRPAQVAAQTTTERERPELVKREAESVAETARLTTAKTATELAEEKLRRHGLEEVLQRERTAKNINEIDPTARKTLETTGWGMQRVWDILAPFLSTAKTANQTMRR